MGERLATAALDADHSAFVERGAICADPTLTPGYDADEPTPGTLLVVMDRHGWGTLHRIDDRRDGKISFGPRLPWPDGSTAARRLPGGTP